MDDIAKRLMEMKKNIEDKKVKKSRYEGKLETLQEQLKKDFGCASVEEAQDKLDEMEKDLKIKRQQLSDGMEKLEGAYEW